MQGPPGAGRGKELALSGLLAPRIVRDQISVLQATQCAVTCYSSHGKLVQVGPENLHLTSPGDAEAALGLHLSTVMKHWNQVDNSQSMVPLDGCPPPPCCLCPDSLLESQMGHRCIR